MRGKEDAVKAMMEDHFPYFSEVGDEVTQCVLYSTNRSAAKLIARQWQ